MRLPNNYSCPDIIHDTFTTLHTTNSVKCDGCLPKDFLLHSHKSHFLHRKSKFHPHCTQVLTSKVKWRIDVECGLFADRIDGLGRPTVDGQRQSLVRCYQLHSMETAIVHCLHTERDRMAIVCLNTLVIHHMNEASVTLYVRVPVYSRRRIGSSIIADPEASPVQLHGNVIIVSFIQQHAAVLVCRNLKHIRGPMLVAVFLNVELLL